MRNAKRSGVDTISNLPGNVLDRILGSLPLKDAVKTSVLSKDWRYKWVTRETLEFDDKFFKSLAHVKAAKTIIYQVLLLHKGPILKFSFQGPNCADIIHWILFMAKKNVQEITLLICPGNRYHLPSQLFTFQQLRHLKIYQCLFHPPPSFKGFDKLISLDFSGVTFLQTIFTNLISVCPLLERLRLCSYEGFDTLEIDAANLKCFEFRGKSKSICFKNAPMLGKVHVYLESPVLTDASNVCSNFMKFFHYMPSLQELDIGGYLLKYLTIGGVPESSLTALNNVKILRIRSISFSNIEEFSGVFYLITSCPKLLQLTITCDSSDEIEPIVQFLRAQSVSYGVLKLLQRVNMSMFSGYEMEMEFVRFILASAPVLEEFYVWNYDCLLFQPVKKIVDEMKQFQRVSPNVEFIFNEVEVLEELYTN